MATVKLLCFFLWRMALLGSALGAGLGLVYGTTLMLASLIVTCAMDLATCFGGTVNPVGGTLYFAVAGAVFGLLLGTLGGSAPGLVGGLILGISTRLFYHPPTDGARYHNAAGMICGATGLLLLFAAWAKAGFGPTTFLVPVFTPSFFSRAWLDLVFITFTPTIAATSAMYWADVGHVLGRKEGRRVVRRQTPGNVTSYFRESAKGETRRILLPRTRVNKARRGRAEAANSPGPPPYIKLHQRRWRSP